MVSYTSKEDRTVPIDAAGRNDGTSTYPVETSFTLTWGYRDPAPTEYEEEAKEKAEKARKKEEERKKKERELWKLDRKNFNKRG